MSNLWYDIHAADQLLAEDCADQLALKDAELAVLGADRNVAYAERDQERRLREAAESRLDGYRMAVEDQHRLEEGKRLRSRPLNRR